MEQVIKEIEEQQYGWLVRTSERGYFGCVTDPALYKPGGVRDGTLVIGAHYARGDTPEEALRRALDHAQSGYIGSISGEWRNG